MHTTEPWTLSDKYLKHFTPEIRPVRQITIQGFQIALISAFDDERDSETEANAKLIVAAPELLEALQGMVELYNAMMEKVDHKNSFYDANTISLMNNSPIAAYKAIKKATE